MILTVVPFATLAAKLQPVPGVQSFAVSDAQITSAVCSTWYYKDGVWTKLADYNTIDAAFEGMRALYVGPLADASITDTDGDGNLSNELYAAAGSPVIKLNGNFQGAYARPNWATNNGTAQIKYDMNKVVTFVIDGAKNETENYTMTFGTSEKAWNEQAFNYLSSYNLTVKNTNIVINSGANVYDGVFCWTGNADVTPGESFTVFENCFIQQNATSTGGSGCLFKMNGKAKFNSEVTADPCKTDKYNLILKDTTVETGTGIGHQAHWGVDANIELYNSTMTLTGNGGDNSNNNDALLKFYEAGTGRVYMDANSKLMSRRTRAASTTCLIRVLSNQKAPVSIELEKGAELVMMNSASLTNKTYIADGGKGKTTITDRGAVYTAFATDAKGGVNLPNISGANWLVGSGISGKVTSNVYKDTAATRPVSLTSTGVAPITVKKNGTAVSPDVTNINGAFDYVYSQADSDAYTIYLNGGMTTDEYMNPESYDHSKVRTVRIDGQGYNLTSYNSTATFYGIGLYNLKLSNINILSSAVSALDWSPRMNPDDAYANYIATGSNPVVDTYAEFTNVYHAPRVGCYAANLKLKGGNSGAQNLGTYNITMTDSVFECNAADTMFMMNDKGNLNLKVIGTKIIYKGGASDNDGNNYIFALNGAKVDINVQNSANNTSVIYSSSTSKRVTSGIVNNGTGYAVNVTLGKGVQLILDGNNVKTSARFVYSEKASTKVYDDGAIWIVTKELLDNNAAISLPYTMFEDGNHTWYVNGKAITPTYQNASVTDDVVFTHKSDTDPSEGKVAYIEANGKKTYYSTIDEAINALGAFYDAVTTANLTDDALWKAAGSPVIYLYEDITITGETYPSWVTNYNANRVRTVVIKGAADNGNVKITSTVAGAAFAYNAYYNLTLENIDLTCTQGFALFWRGYNNGNKSGKSTTNMINCNISATGTSGEGLVFKVTGNQNQTKTENYIINIVNTDVVAQKGVNAMFLFHHGCAGTLNIDGNSTLRHVMNKQAVGGDTMFMLGTNRQFTINMESGAKLSADIQAGYNAAYKSYAIFRLENSDSYASADGIKNIINIGDGVEMSITGNGNFNMPAYFIDNCLVPTETAKKTILSLGKDVIMSIDANVAADGFGAYAGQACDLGAVLGAYHNGNTAKLYNSKVPAGVITEAVGNITPVFISLDDFDLFDGASIRTIKGDDGIRFSTYYSNEFYNLIKDKSPVFGTLVVPYGKLGSNALTLDNATALTALNIVSTKAHSTSYDSNVLTADRVYHAAVIMPETVSNLAAYQLSLAARAYVTITYADGTQGTVYSSFDSQNNVRSMYQTATNLVAGNPDYLEIEIIRAIIDTVKDSASGILQTNPLTSGATVMGSSTTCKEIEIKATAEELQSIIDAFVGKGYAEVSVNKIASDKSAFEVLVYANDAEMVTFYKMGETVKIMYEDLDRNDIEALAPNATTGEGVGQIVQLGNQRVEEEDNPLNGMCYIIKLGDGRAMIIDGGHPNDEQATNIFNSLRTLGVATDEEGRYIIANWIFTHGHDDHIGAFKKFAALYNGQTVLECVTMNLPADDSIAGYGKAGAVAFDKLISQYYPGTKRINPHAGLTYYVGNATIEVFYTPEVVYTPGVAIDDYNNTSVITRIQVGNNSAFFYGDAGDTASLAMLQMYGASSTEFKSDILQITHHGLYTSAVDGHDWTNLKAVYDLVGATYAFLPMNTEWADDPNDRDGRDTVLCGWGEAGYQVSYIMNLNDIPLICGSTVESAEFKEFDRTGKVRSISVSSVYGYNGKNMIKNGKGLTTYIASDHDSIWVTVFNCGSGKISAPVVNSEFSDWVIAN